MADERQREWIARVLGVACGEGLASAPRPKLLPIWVAAKDEIDSAITRLQEALVATRDDDLLQIAEYGLYGATGGENVALMAALREADAGDDEALQRVRDAARDYQAFLAGAPMVQLVEENPFGVPVPLRKRLGDALAELERLAG
jgi:hypothetical protein